jgi:hypothetical protein
MDHRLPIIADKFQGKKTPHEVVKGRYILPIFYFSLMLF